MMIPRRLLEVRMRTTIVLLAIAVLAVAVLGACRARDDGAPDSVAADSAAPDTAARSADTITSRDTIAAKGASVTPSAPRESPRRSTPAIRRAGDTVTDSLPPDDSIRAMRPKMPQVTPPKRPRTWRGLKLPEAMPVRAPVETIKRVEQVPDSVQKGDSTRPPTP
jgi:hypothetical protein